MKNILFFSILSLIGSSVSYAEKFKGTIKQTIFDHKNSDLSKTKNYLEISKNNEIKRFQLVKPRRLKNNNLFHGINNGDLVEIDGVISKKNTILVSQIALEKKSFELKKHNKNIVSKPVFIILTLDDNPDKVEDKMKKLMKEVKTFYKDVSFGKKEFDIDANKDGSPDVYGSIKITDDKSKCDENYEIWSDKADVIAAEKHGVDFSLYNHKVYIFDKRAECYWAGSARPGCISETPGKDCRSWMNSHDLGIFVHELGHNLGMLHANISGKEDYGDFSDPMGAGYSVFFNPPHTDKMGWFTDQENSIIDIESLNNKNTTFDIFPMSADKQDKKLRALRFGKDGDKIYYISFRVKEGWDKNILPPEFLDKVLIHYIEKKKLVNSNFVKSLKDGESWTFPGKNIKVTAGKSGLDKNISVKIDFN